MTRSIHIPGALKKTSFLKRKKGNSYNFNASTSSQSDPNDKILIHQRMSHLEGRQRKRSALDREAEKDHTRILKKISLHGNRRSEMNHNQNNNSTTSLRGGGIDNKAGSLPRVRISDDAVTDKKFCEEGEDDNEGTTADGEVHDGLEQARRKL